MASLTSANARCTVLLARLRREAATGNLVLRMGRRGRAHPVGRCSLGSVGREETACVAAAQREALLALVQSLGDPGRDLGFDDLQIRAGRRGDGEHELVGLFAVRVVPGRWSQSNPFTSQNAIVTASAVRLLPSGSAWFFVSRTSSTAAFIGKLG
jgi:hypothetical protein